MSKSSQEILINASNLHVGGGVQVATSFLYELSFIKSLSFTPTVYLSTKIKSELEKLGVNTKQKNWIVHDTYGLSNYFKNKKLFSKFDIVFTVFGPYYFMSKHQKAITGFAQPWIIYPNNEVFKQLTITKKIKTKLKFFLQKLFFKTSSQLVVELDHVKDQLVNLKVQNSNQIHIVKNCFSSLYLDPSKWEKLTIPSSPSKIKLGIVTRDYPHKNLSILPTVKNILLDQYNIDTDFYVTLNNNEWEVRDNSFKESIINVGSLSISQCPAFYQNLDGLIFPSLLECFSASPLEAMVTQTPVFASERRFVKDVCGNFAYYFDPLDAKAIAKVIVNYFETPIEARQTQLKLAKEYAMNFSSAKGRAERYISIIQAALK